MEVIAPDGHVEQEEEFLLERRSVLNRKLEGGFVHAVHAEGHAVTFPECPVGVELGGGVAHRGAGISFDRIASVPLRRVEGVADRIGIAGRIAAPFQHVDFATVRPADRPDVVAHHPGGGPRADSGRQFGPEFDQAIFENALVLCLDPGRGPGTVRFHGLDDQAAVFHAEVLGVGSVSLHFVVAPTAVARFWRPVAGVERRAVEFVRPDELVSFGVDLFGRGAHTQTDRNIIKVGCAGVGRVVLHELGDELHFGRAGGDGAVGH